MMSRHPVDSWVVFQSNLVLLPQSTWLENTPPKPLLSEGSYKSHNLLRWSNTEIQIPGIKERHTVDPRRKTIISGGRKEESIGRWKKFLLKFTMLFRKDVDLRECGPCRRRRRPIVFDNENFPSTLINSGKFIRSY